MLDVTPIKRQRVGQVVNYYLDGADDYYAKDGSSMQWQGEGAEMLGLEGEVEQARFAQLLNGRIDENTKLKRSFDGNEKSERLGYDFTFSAPKGVSLQALVSGDKRIIEAHDNAVQAAMKEAERLAQARSTVNKKTSIENTGNLVIANFRHETSRAQDPDLHTHSFVMNMTRREDGEWRALRNDGLFKHKEMISNVYKAELARELERQGFQLRYNHKNNTFDMAHFSDEQIRHFSQRGKQIEDKLASQGLTRETATREQKSAASMQTRKAKGTVDREVLASEWKGRANELGIDFERREWAGPGQDRDAHSTRNSAPQQFEKPIEHQADKALSFAIKSLSERSAIMSDKEIVNVALKHGYGSLALNDIRDAQARALQRGHLIREETVYESGKSTQKDPIAPMTKTQWAQSLASTGVSPEEAKRLVRAGIDSGRLKEVEPRFTTQEAQRRERSILKMEREGRGTITPKASQELATKVLAGKTLKDEQLAAVNTIVFTPNQQVAAHGFAGTGKTYMTVAAKEVLEAAGNHVTSLAPYGSQVKALQDEGIESRTLASFLKAKDKKIGPDSVVFIDEAGVIPASQMEQTLKTIKEHGARVVFLGDTKQTKAVEAGKPFEQLINAGMETSYLKDIQRQKNPELLKAVLMAAEGQSKSSLAYVTKINELENGADRYREIVKRYVNLEDKERAQTLVITGTNSSRLAINEGVRRELGLQGKGMEYGLLNRLDSTQAERQHSKYYQDGAVIIPEKDYKNGLKNGEAYKVIDNGPGNKLTVEGKDGEVISFSPARYSRLSVYSVEKTELAIGDQVKITRNDATNDLANGDRFKVKGISKEQLTLVNESGRTVKLDATKPMYAGLAYASTVHSAQGLTCDRVLINMESASRTTDRDVYYVAISRARHEAEIFTDSREKLDKVVGRESMKTAALEINQLRRHAQNRTRPENGRESGTQRKKEHGRDSSPLRNAGKQRRKPAENERERN